MRPRTAVTIFSIVLAAAVCCAEGYGFSHMAVDSVLGAEADSMFSVDGDEQITRVHVVEDTTTRYYAASVKTVDCSIDELWRMLSSFRGGDVPSIRYILEAERVCGAGGIHDSCAYFIEVGVSMARSWFLCDIDTLRDSVSTRRTVTFDQNHDPKLNARVRELPHGWVTVEYDSFVIEWWMEPRAEGTRFGIFALVDPNIWIPNWLFKAVSKRVFPSMLTGVEKHLVRAKD